MKRIGLTGGIGSGKTYVAKVFESLGVPVFYADVEAKKLLNTSASLINSIKNNFGENVYIDGKLDKKKISQIIFSNDNKLKEINNLVHPEVSDLFKVWCLDQSSSYVIKEAAIIFESKSYLKLDAVICVAAPLEVRIERILNRDNTTKKEIKNRIKNQISQEEKESLSDFIIINDEKEMLLPQIISIHEKISQELIIE